MTDYTTLTDAELYKKCREVGVLSLQYRKQFCGMLPEVTRRKLYEKYGMSSLYEFAAKLAGLSRETVNEVLRVHRLLEDKLMLQQKLISGEVGYTKLRSVAKVATSETQEAWLEKVEKMSGKTLEVYVKEIKNQDGLRAKADDDFVTLSLKVKPRTAGKMRVFRQRLEKKLKKSVDWDMVLQELLKLSEKLVKTKAVSRTKTSQGTRQGEKAKSVSRYIHAEIRHKINEKYEGLCAFPGCARPATNLHHTRRYALHREHDEKTIAPLCDAHNEIAHLSLIGNEEKSPHDWKILHSPDKSHPKYSVDLLVQKFRMQTYAT